MRRTILSIFVLSCIIIASSLAQVRRTKPIFGRCIDKELGAILKIITVLQDRRIAKSPTKAMEIDLKVDSIMRMIKQYLTEERNMPDISSRRSRKFFFWPFQSWFAKEVAIQGGVRGTISGGFGPGGFHISAGLDGGILGAWSSNRRRNFYKLRTHE